MPKVNLFLLLTLCLFLTQANAHEYIPNNTPNSRYEIHDDGTVTDTHTGLMWQRCLLGIDSSANNCNGSISQLNWQEALQAADDSVLAGYNDWRLPNVNELLSLVARDRMSPSINQEVFPGTLTGNHWTSSPSPQDSSNSSGRSFYVNFTFGYDSTTPRNNTKWVRLVRGAQ
jgi:hypothetical protein